jgi:hypothetical protein
MVYASRGSSGSENFEMKFVRKHNKIILLWGKGIYKIGTIHV